MRGRGGGHSGIIILRNLFGCGYGVHERGRGNMRNNGRVEAKYLDIRVVKAILRNVL